MKLNFNKRIYVIGLVLLIYAAITWVQALRTLVIHGDAYRSKVEQLKFKAKPIEPIRGFIFADGGELLAGSLPEYDVYLEFYSTTKPDYRGRINIPHDTIAEYFRPGGTGSRALAHAFSNPARNTKSADQFGNEVRAAYRRRDPHKLLLRALPYLDYKHLREQPYFCKSSNRNGLVVEERAHRYRPYGENRMASATIGTVYTKSGADSTQQAGHGLRGIEKAYDHYLAGTPGLGYRQKIRRSYTNVTIEPPVDGANVHTTINVEMQEILDYELNKRLLDLHAAEGWAAFVEVETGKIKAISNLRREGDHCVEDYNHLFEDLVDPGSTFKTVSYMILLEDEKIKPDDIIDTGNYPNNESPWKYRSQRISDDHPVGRNTMEEMIVQSSNIGVAKATTKAYASDPQRYLDAIEQIGFLNDRPLKDLDRDEIKAYGYLKHLELRNEFPGAQAARHRQINSKTWSGVSLAQISYGYETQIPGIYMLQFYNAIANGGKMVRPYIVEEVEKNGKTLYKQSPTVINRKICSRETLRHVRRALEGVVDHGTAAGRPASDPKGPLPGVKTDRVKIAGKTGTAQRRNTVTGRFSGAGHNVSFVGYFPADEPQYCGIVVINTYGSGHSNAGGGYMAGPVFRHFAERVYALHCRRSLRDIPADTVNVEPHVKESPDLDGVVPGVMPNVKGMGARDALLMLETAGYSNVEIQGTGRVVSQSGNAGRVVLVLK
ncbi:MAG: PASTA domain-containing protein [Bacteroidales bacterium]|nr:PASTA domain-containing protein [Bacteroidales bacterium]